MFTGLWSILLVYVSQLCQERVELRKDRASFKMLYLERMRVSLVAYLVHILHLAPKRAKQEEQDQ